jgi:hypothetical protein
MAPQPDVTVRHLDSDFAYDIPAIEFSGER